jgi:hypothetical protein
MPTGHSDLDGTWYYINQQLETVHENLTLQQRHRLQVGELVVQYPYLMRHSTTADAEATMHYRHV